PPPGHRPGGLRSRLRLRPRARAGWPADHRAPGDLDHARRRGHEHRAGADAALARGLDGRPRPRARTSTGRHGLPVRLPVGAAGGDERAGGPRRPGLPAREPGREAGPRRAYDAAPAHRQHGRPGPAGQVAGTAHRPGGARTVEVTRWRSCFAGLTSRTCAPRGTAATGWTWSPTPYRSRRSASGPTGSSTSRATPPRATTTPTVTTSSTCCRAR